LNSEATTAKLDFIELGQFGKQPQGEILFDYQSRA
jgi:hypothetical protein